MSPMRTHQLEGRKREERVGELRNMARHKRGLTNWRGGRGRRRVGNFRTGRVTNEDSKAGGEGGRRAGWGKREEGGEGEKRGEGVGELQSMARQKGGLTNWRGGRGRSGLVSFKAWHVTNEDSLAGGEEEGGAGW